MVVVCVRRWRRMEWLHSQACMRWHDASMKSMGWQCGCGHTRVGVRGLIRCGFAHQRRCSSTMFLPGCVCVRACTTLRLPGSLPRVRIACFPLFVCTTLTDGPTPHHTHHVRSSYEVLRRAGYFGVSTQYVGKWSVEMGRAITSGRAFELKIASMVWTKAEAVALGLALASAGCRVHTIAADTVTGEKLACLAACAEGWQTVKTLNIYCNALGPTGAAALAPALAKMIHLETLDIRGNALDAPSKQLIRDAVPAGCTFPHGF